MDIFNGLIGTASVDVEAISIEVGESVIVNPSLINYNTIKVVKTVADFPAPFGNLIYLADNTIYFIDSGDLDITGYTIVFNNRSQLNGYGQNVSKISSSTSGTASTPYVFFKSETNLFMNDLEIECKGNYQRIWEHIGNGTVPEGESFELNRFNILNEQAPGHGCQLGYISNIRQGFIGTLSCFNFEKGFICADSWSGGFRVDNTIFINCRGVFFGSDPLLPVTFARRVSSNANLTVPLGSIGYDFPETSFSFSGQYQLQNGNVRGAGQYVTEWSGQSPAYNEKSNFQNNTGIQNTFPGGEWINTLDTATDITATNVWATMSAVTTERGLTWFSETGGEWTYLSETPLDIQASLTVSLAGSTNNIIEIKIVKVSGVIQTDLLSRKLTIQGTLAQGKAESISIMTTTQVILNDKIVVLGRNLSANQDFTLLSDSNMIINAK